jgi:hypothetical protein
MEVSSQFYDQGALVLGGSSHWPLHRKLGVLQGPFRCSGEGKDFWPCQKSYPNFSAIQPVACCHTDRAVEIVVLSLYGATELVTADPKHLSVV